MTTNNFPGIGYIVNGRDFNYYTKFTVTASTYGGNSVDGYQPDIVIPFSSFTVSFQLENAGNIQYSFNGTTTHGDMIDGYASETLLFQNRTISKIWFKGSGVVRVESWGT